MKIYLVTFTVLLAILAEVHGMYLSSSCLTDDDCVFEPMEKTVNVIGKV